MLGTDWSAGGVSDRGSQSPRAVWSPRQQGSATVTTNPYAMNPCPVRSKSAQIRFQLVTWLRAAGLAPHLEPFRVKNTGRGCCPVLSWLSGQQETSGRLVTSAPTERLAADCAPKKQADDVAERPRRLGSQPHSWCQSPGAAGLSPLRGPMLLRISRMARLNARLLWLKHAVSRGLGVYVRKRVKPGEFHRLSGCSPDQRPWIAGCAA